MTDGFLPATTLPRDYYVSPAIHEREIETIFRRQWVCVGRDADIPGAGDWFAAEIAGESLLVTRGRDGAVRAFFNLCRHRGTRLCADAGGRFAESIRCPYHGWSYGLDGRLLGAPLMNEVPGFDRGDWPLHEAGLALWEGFVFVSLAERPEPFERAFAPMLGRLSRFNIAGLRSARRIEYDVKSNWKLVFQNYGECLHCPVLHPLLSTRTPYLSGTNDLIEGPFLGGSMDLTVTDGSMTASGRRCAPQVGDLPVEDRNRAYYYSILPNLLLSPHPDYVMFHTLWPKGPEATHIVCEWLFHPRTFSEPGHHPEDAIEFWDITNREDWRISELSMAGIRSRRYGPGPYSARESILAAWDREYLRLMGQPSRPAL